MPQTKTQRSLVRMTPDFVARIEAWALAQPDTPSRAEAMRRLIAKALLAEEGPLYEGEVRKW